ncbi:ABC transporter permease [Alkalibacillus aidingensis]|uniref:ABC transporter permease n=1 Tax=Alkalibacillus aidingensis TaxID=2747607 RepID=UPI00166130D1|nr:ABC transporter permease [Alkalibacillus aidingensis]
MVNFLKKDVLILIRDRTELLVLLLMPFVLTAILGFALGGVMSEEGFSELKVAIVQEDDTEAGVQQFIDDVNSAAFPDEAKVGMTEAAESFQPFSIIEEALFSDDLEGVVKVSYLAEDEALEAVQDEEILAIIKVPEDFTYQALQKMILDEGEGSELIIQSSDHSALAVDIVDDIISTLVDQINLETAIAQVGGEEAITSTEEELSIHDLGGVESVTDQEPLSMLQYYTFGMAVMFALYVASTMGSKAYIENYQHVFDRILLSGRSRNLYLSGKWVSTIVLVVMQIFILLVASSLVFQAFQLNNWAYWGGIGLISLVYALTIGSLGTLLVAMAMRTKSNAIPNVFAFGIVSVFAFLGGSFAPMFQLPDVINQMGLWVPNGVAMNAYLQWTQGLGLSAIGPLLVRLLVMAIVIFSMSLFIFPKRRVA